MKKRFLSMFLCLCMVAGMVPGIISTAYAYNTGDDYPSDLKAKDYWWCYYHADNRDAWDPWYFITKQCTSFVAHCLNSRNGVSFTNSYKGVTWSHAGNWGNAARSCGITVDMTPAVGAVAWWNYGTYGHVAWVSALDGGYVWIEEYNGTNTGAFSSRRIEQSDVSGYIHIKDIGGSSTPSQPSYPTNAQNLDNDFYAYISYPKGNFNLENRNNNVQIATKKASDPRQIWHFIRLGDGTYNIVNMYDGRYLDVLNGGGSGTNVWACTGNGDTPQKWKIVNDAYGMSGAYNLLISYNNSLALDVAYPATSAGTNVQIWDRNTESQAQTFQINKISNIGSAIGYNMGADFYAQISYDGAYLQTAGGKIPDGSGYGIDVRTTRTSNTSSPNQIWHFIRQSNGSYKIVNMGSGWCLDAQTGIAANGKNIWTWWDDHGGAPERWYIFYSAGDSSYRLMSAINYPWTGEHNLYSIDLHNSSGEKVQLWQQNENPWQYFKITEVSYNPAPVVTPSYIITTSASPAQGGTVTGGGGYEKGKTATVTAAANEGYRFVGWTENGSTVRTSASYPFTVNEDRTLTAVFEKAPVVTPSYIITTAASPSAGGTASGDGQFPVGKTVAVTATPNEGYVFKGWMENGSIVSADDSYAFTVSASRDLIAVFEKKETSTPALPTDFTTEAEKNDAIELANRISVNTEIAGSISKSSDVDWFVFQVPSDGYISLTFSHDFVDSSYTYWKTAFYTSDNKELNSWLWKGNATSAETGNKIGVPAGTYYLRVSDHSFSSAAYRFKVNYTPSGSWEKEFNETIVTANRIPANAEISGSIRNSSDVDWFAFQVPSDGYISLTFGHDFVDSSYTYWKTAFYTSDNKELNSWLWKGNATSEETGNKIGVPAGTYYLRVSDHSFSSAAYRFKVNYTPSGSWEKEFNETIVTANRIPTDTEISGSIRNSSDVDWYQFELPENGTISLTFSHDFVDSSYAYWKTAFYTSDNKELNSWLWKGNTTSAVTGDKVGLSAGTYYLRVSDRSFSSATYRFKVNYGSPNNPGSGDDQKPVAVSGVTLSKTALSLTPGSSAVLAAQVTPSSATDKTVVWRSENTAVATVAGGRVTAVGEGSTRIIASCGNVTASCVVSVKTEESPTRPSEVHFARVNIYFQDQFTDVPANQWYTNSVAEAFELGLMKGNSTTTFNPYGDVKISEAITMAARIYSAYSQDGETFQRTGSNWYQVYVDYAYKNGIISLAYYNCDVTQKASRAQFAEIFANSMPAEGLAAMNNVANGAIPDVGMGNRYAEYIYRLYRAGILTGSDANGTFNPTTYITRAEAAAIVSRMAESNNRVSITLR